jgi:hypothetical protein
VKIVKGLTLTAKRAFPEIILRVCMSTPFARRDRVEKLASVSQD